MDDIKTKKYEIEEIDRRFLVIAFPTHQKALELDPEDTLEDFTADPTSPVDFIVTLHKTGDVIKISKGKMDWWGTMTARVKREVKPKKVS